VTMSGCPGVLLVKKKLLRTGLVSSSTPGGTVISVSDVGQRYDSSTYNDARDQTDCEYL
jgi:hypothetical protein